MPGTRYPNGFKDKDNVPIASDLTVATKTSAAADADKVNLDADLVVLFAEVNKQKAIIEKLLGL
jgi:hypothetical protein